MVKRFTHQFTEPIFRWTFVFLVVMLAAFLGAVSATIAEPDAWAPLGPYPEQTVLETTETSVTVEGTKCTKEDAVDIIGVQSWVSVEPPGFVHVVGSGVGIRHLGCDTRIFSNPIPQAVLDEEMRHGPRTWRITGVETPVNGSSEGVPLTWTTEVFSLTIGK